METTKKVHDLLKDFPTLMVSTFEQTGPSPVARPRPMAVAGIEEDCTLWFVTDKESSKVVEATGLTPGGHVVGQGKTQFVALQGKYDVVTDPKKIEQYWSKAFEAWFPDGPTDPHVCLMRFTPSEAEVWDSSGLKGLKYMFETAKAFVTGEKPKADKEQHRKVDLRD